MQCYFNLISSHKTILDEEGIEVADMKEARAFARGAIAEMVQDGVAEIAHWRGWEIETRDASGAVLFTIGFDALLPPEAREQPSRQKSTGGTAPKIAAASAAPASDIAPPIEFELAQRSH